MPGRSLPLTRTVTVALWPDGDAVLSVDGERVDVQQWSTAVSGLLAFARSASDLAAVASMGSCTSSELAQKLGCTRSAASSRLSSMERDGLLVRERQSRRGYVYSLR